MKVLVQFAGLGQETRASLTSHIREKWPAVMINSESPNEVKDGPHAILLVGTKSTTSNASSQHQATLLVEGATLEEACFLVDAELGRLTKSDPLKADANHSVTSPMSRRDFLFGALRKSAEPNDVPVVFHDSCEAKFGCRKCVEACPAPGALHVDDNSLQVSNEHCVRCGLCAGVCPVAAIQTPTMPERAYGGLLMEIHKAPDSRKMLVITCDKQRIPRRPWMVIEQVPGIAVMGLRQLAMAASSSVAAMVVYCPDGKCVGKEHVQRAVNSIATLSRSTRAPIHYLEGVEGLEEIERIYGSTQGRNMPLELAADPWKTYTHALVSLSDNHSQADALGLTDMRVDESCTLCNACVDKCPHGALAIQEGNLVFESQNCTGCGYCERICPEHSITLSEMRGPTTMRPRPVYSGEMTRCVKCGNPYASARMIEKVSTILHDDGVLRLCPECRQRETYENLFGGSYKPV